MLCARGKVKIAIMNKRILVVDDDPRLRNLLVRYLGEQGYIVQAAGDSAAMDRMLARERFDALVLDLMLPGEDGLAICRRLRSAGEDMAIIMLTARGDEVDRIIGLEMGADDYLPKPFNPRELLARINAVMRRRVPAVQHGAPVTGEVVSFGGFRLEPATRRLLRGSEAVPLTSGEFTLLHVLVTHARQPLSRDKLMELTRGREMGAFDRSIDVQISRLRKLIEPDPTSPRFIQTVWGFGYVFIPQEEA
jgi:two-component system, OmpR family, phosphate regulon response regulator OmpR